MRLARRLAVAVISAIVISAIAFLIFRAVPGDPERLMLAGARGVTPELVAQLRARWGLDRPLVPDQLVAYYAALLRGDLGYSFKYRGETVAGVVGARLGPTILLVGIAQVIAITVGTWLGARAGWRRDGALDRIGSSLALAAYGMPTFWLGMLLILGFASGLGWFPVTGLAAAGGIGLAGWLDLAWRGMLPVLTLAIAQTGQYVLIMRAAVIDVRSEDFILTARAKGIGDRSVLRQHAVPNARLPVVTLVALNIGYVVAGAITVEVVFSWPGLGRLTVEAMQARDYPVLQAVFLLFAISIVLANLAADLIYARLDPRARA